MNEEEQNIEALLLDVIRGYSKVQSNNQTFYLKHFLVYESLQLEEFQQEALNEAIKKGIKSEKEIIEDAIKRGHWSVKEEESIKSIRWMIEKSESAASKITDNIARKSFEASISKQREELQELQSRRDSLTAHSADNLAKRKKIYKEIAGNLFKDEQMTVNVDRDDVFDLMPIISKKISKFHDTNMILKMAYSPAFFDIYCLMYRQPHKIIGSNIFNVSIWQKSLLFYASILLNKLKNYNVPDDVREDPIKLYKYSEKDQSHDGSKVTHGIDDLRAKMAEKGGKLTAEDF